MADQGADARFYQQTIRDLHSKVETLEAEKLELAQDCTNQVTAKDEEITSLERRLIDEENNTRQVEGQYTYLESQTEEVKIGRDEALNKIKTRDEEIKKLKDDARAREDYIEDIEGKLADALAAQSEAEETKKVAERTVTRLTGELAEEKEALRNTRASHRIYQANVDGIQVELNTANGIIRDLRAQIDQYQTEIAAHQADQATLEMVRLENAGLEAQLKAFTTDASNDFDPTPKAYIAPADISPTPHLDQDLGRKMESSESSHYSSNTQASDGEESSDYYDEDEATETGSDGEEQVRIQYVERLIHVPGPETILHIPGANIVIREIITTTSYNIISSWFQLYKTIFLILLYVFGQKLPQFLGYCSLLNNDGLAPLASPPIPALDNDDNTPALGDPLSPNNNDEPPGPPPPPPPEGSPRSVPLPPSPPPPLPSPGPEPAAVVLPNPLPQTPWAWLVLLLNILLHAALYYLIYSVWEERVMWLGANNLTRSVIWSYTQFAQRKGVDYSVWSGWFSGGIGEGLDRVALEILEGWMGIERRGWTIPG